MSSRTAWPCKNGMEKRFFKNYKISAGYTWDLSHGRGWHVRGSVLIYDSFMKEWIWDFVIDPDSYVFHKNKFTAVRECLKKLDEYLLQQELAALRYSNEKIRQAIIRNGGSLHDPYYLPQQNLLSKYNSGIDRYDNYHKK